MNADIEGLIKKHGLLEHKTTIAKYLQPCVSFDLRQTSAQLPVGASKVGGGPDLPLDFEWPGNKGRPLNFLLQINLAVASGFDPSGRLPSNGLLSFFYDLDEQPWGYDPNDQDGFRVVFSPSDVELGRRPAAQSDYDVNECEVVLRSGVSLPNVGSIDFDRFDAEAKLSDEESNNFFEFADDVASLGSSYAHKYGGHHHLLGHSENVQGDMQTEAQLVTNGLYCGDETGYNDPRAAELKKHADDWLLLLQLDSDDEGGFMWGDAGMLYYWIRKQDLAQRIFDKTWMALQCG